MLLKQPLRQVRASLLSIIFQYSSRCSVIITLLILLSLWPFGGAEDIINARENIYSGEKTDFWGGFAQFFYSSWNLPSPYWHIALGVFHAALVLLGTLVGIDYFRSSRSRVRLSLIVLILHYFSTAYVLSLSRDGTLLAFIWCGFALFSRGVCLNRESKILIISGIVLMAVGISFRPWMAVGLALTVFFGLKKSSVVKLPSLHTSMLIIGTLFMTLFPVSLDFTTRKAMELQSSYPEQQVIIMDLTSIACLSPNRKAQVESLKALEILSVSPGLSRETLCGQYYPQNWASTTFYSNPESPALRLLTTNEYSNYTKIRNLWLDLVMAYPADYIQIKTFQFSQFFLAGDSSSLAINNLWKVAMVPYEIIRSCRLFSFFPILVLFLLLIFTQKSIVGRASIFVVFVSYLVSMAVITIAFIGDNQRYISWLPLFCFFALSFFWVRDEIEE